MRNSRSNRGIKKALCVLLFWLVLPRMPAVAENQSWLNNSLYISLVPRLRMVFTNEFRNQEFTFMNHYLANVQGGVEYALFQNTYIAFLYKRENTKKKDYLLNENRFTLESGWKTELGPNVHFDLRFKTEGRTYEEGKADNHFRFRLRLRLTGLVELGHYSFKPFIATEPFANTLSNTIHQNRFSLGVSFPLGQHSTFVLNYLRQDTKNKESLHILNAGFQLKF